MKKLFAILLSVFLSSLPVKAEIDLRTDRWTLNEEVDEFTDEKKLFAVVQSEDGNGLLAAACHGAGDGEKSFEFKIITGEYIGDKKHYVDNVMYRVDKLEPVETKFKSSKHAVYINDFDHRIFSDMAVGSTLVVRVFDYEFDQQIRRFSLVGSAKALGSVIEGCGGPPLQTTS